MNAREIFSAVRAAGRDALLEPEAKAVLREFGIAVPRSVVVDDETQLDAAAALRAPYALKVVSPEMLHKSDAGGVRLGLADLAAVSSALVAMRRKVAAVDASARFLVEEMAPRGHELVVGGTMHPQFGPVLMVGLGGIFVEIVDDVAFRLCPITTKDAWSMLDELRGRAILDGARGGTAADAHAIVAVLMKIGGEGGVLAQLGEGLRELDINPLIVGADHAFAVDARILLAPAQQR